MYGNLKRELTKDEVERVLDQKVRPYIKNHNGSIKVLSIEDGKVKVLLLGECSCCPSARLTFDELVRAEILNSVTGVKDVVLESNISEDMILLAKKILNKD